MSLLRVCGTSKFLILQSLLGGGEGGGERKRERRREEVFVTEHAVANNYSVSGYHTKLNVHWTNIMSLSAVYHGRTRSQKRLGTDVYGIKSLTTWKDNQWARLAPIWMWEHYKSPVTWAKVANSLWLHEPQIQLAVVWMWFETALMLLGTVGRSLLTLCKMASHSITVQGCWKKTLYIALLHKIMGSSMVLACDLSLV